MPESPSATLAAATEIEGMSSSTMVPVTAGVRIVALAAWLARRITVSSSSTTVSPFTDTSIVPVELPAGMTSVPEAAA